MLGVYLDEGFDRRGPRMGLILILFVGLVVLVGVLAWVNR